MRHRAGSDRDPAAPTSTFDVDVLATAYGTYSIALTLNGDLARARAHLEKSLERSTSIGHLNTRGTSLLTSSVCCYFLDDHERAVDLARMTIEATSNRGFHTFSRRRASSKAGESCSVAMRAVSTT